MCGDSHSIYLHFLIKCNGKLFSSVKHPRVRLRFHTVLPTEKERINVGQSPCAILLMRNSSTRRNEQRVLGCQSHEQLQPDTIFSVVFLFCFFNEERPSCLSHKLQMAAESTQGDDDDVWLNVLRCWANISGTISQHRHQHSTTYLPLSASIPTTSTAGAEINSFSLPRGSCMISMAEPFPIYL